MSISLQDDLAELLRLYYASEVELVALASNAHPAKVLNAAMSTPLSGSASPKLVTRSPPSANGSPKQKLTARSPVQEQGWGGLKDFFQEEPKSPRPRIAPSTPPAEFGSSSPSSPAETPRRRTLVARDDLSERRAQRQREASKDSEPEVGEDSPQYKPAGLKIDLVDFLTESKPEPKVARALINITPRRGSLPSPDLLIEARVAARFDCEVLAPPLPGSQVVQGSVRDSKRRAAKRETLHGLGLESVNTSLSAAASGHAKSKSLSLRERPSRSQLATSSTESQSNVWLPATAILRENGVLLIRSADRVFAEVCLSTLLPTDVRLVDATLFTRRHVASVPKPQTESAAPASPTLEQKRTKLQPRLPSPLVNGRSAQVEEHTPADRIYLGFADAVNVNVFYAILQCYTSPASTSSSFRFWQGGELSIVEGRGLGERAAASSLTVSRSVSMSLSGMLRGTSPIPLGSSPRSDSGRFEANEASNSFVASVGLANVELYCEISVNGQVIGRTSAKKASVSPMWRESFPLLNLPPLTESIVIRLYQAPHRKNSSRTLLGTATLPSSFIKANESFEEWLPVIGWDSKSMESQQLGEIAVTMRLDAVRMLPLSEYSEMRQLLLDTSTPHLAYDLVAAAPSQLDRIAELLLSVYLCNGQLSARVAQMCDIEIDGRTESVGTLFRGKSLLTKLLEIYMRMCGTEFLQASIGETVHRLISQCVELEIDPTRSKSASSVQTDAEELGHWAAHTWTALFAARGKCPNELKELFAHVQSTVEKRFEQGGGNSRFTCISAFVFLRFFVPALLAPKTFGLAFAHPEPPVQRTLTLLAKTLQGLANMRPFENKEPFMAVMNSFLVDHAAFFTEYISYLATPKAAAPPTWTSPCATAYKSANTIRAGLSEQQRDRAPVLPHLLDETRDLALLASLVARSANNQAPRRRREVSASSHSSGSSVEWPSSDALDRLIRVCNELHALAEPEELRTPTRSLTPSSHDSSPINSRRRPGTSSSDSVASSPSGSPSRSRVLSGPADIRSDRSPARSQPTLAFDETSGNVVSSTRPDLPRASQSSGAVASRLRRMSSGDPGRRARARSNTVTASRTEAESKVDEAAAGSGTFRRLFGLQPR